jgi:hypothetical protein
MDIPSNVEVSQIVAVGLLCFLTHSSNSHRKTRAFPAFFSNSQSAVSLSRPTPERGNRIFGRHGVDIVSIDWLLGLPAVLDQEFWHEFHQFEEGKRIPYVTSVERLGMQKGVEQGQLQAAREMLLEAVATRFGEVSQDVTAAVQRLETVEPMRVLLRQALTCASLEAFRDALRTVQG